MRVNSLYLWLSFPLAKCSASDTRARGEPIRPSPAAKLSHPQQRFPIKFLPSLALAKTQCSPSRASARDRKLKRSTPIATTRHSSSPSIKRRASSYNEAKKTRVQLQCKITIQGLDASESKKKNEKKSAHYARIKARLVVFRDQLETGGLSRWPIDYFCMLSRVICIYGSVAACIVACIMCDSRNCRNKQMCIYALRCCYSSRKLATLMRAWDPGNKTLMGKAGTQTWLVSVFFQDFVCFFLFYYFYFFYFFFFSSELKHVFLS